MITLRKVKNDIFNPIFSWLMKTGQGNEFYFRTDKNLYQQGEEIKLIGKSINNKKLTNGIVNVFNNGEKIDSKPINFNSETNLYTGKFWATKSGNLDYQILSFKNDNSIPITKGSFIVQDSQIELNNVYLNKSSLISVAHNTGGTFALWSNRNDIIEKINLNFRKDSYKDVIYLKSNAIILILLFIFLILDWYMKKN